MKTRKQFITGSRAFFDGMEGFTPHDTDIVEFDDTMPVDAMQINRGDTTIFKLKVKSAEDMIDYLSKRGGPTSWVCGLLVPEIADHLGMTVEKLPLLQPYVEALDDRHKYLAVIYDAYVKDGKMRLTKAQRDKAFRCYIEARKGA